MASSGMLMGLLTLAMVSMLSGRVMGQSTSSCTKALSSLTPCLNYVTGNSSSPSFSCCSQLGNVVQASPQCLCQVLTANGASLGFTINQTLALSLPGACKVQTPPIAQCQAATAPTSSAFPPASALAPATSPISSPPELSPATSPVAATAGSPTETSNETPEPATTTTPSIPQVPSTPAGTGSKTVPSTTASSGGSFVEAPARFLLFVCFIAAYGSTVLRF